MLKLPRHAEIWAIPYLRDSLRRPTRPRHVARAWVAITDHFEPLWNNVDPSLARERVSLWHQRWPEIARRIQDRTGVLPRYTFFFPEEEYRPEFLEPLAQLTSAGIADVEVHLHHDRDTAEGFVERVDRFCRVLRARHGLLREVNGKTRFGFIHGNWALDNSLPDGRWCGLNNEITLLKQLGCYADFTMPSGNCASQARILNRIYMCTDDPERPKSYDTGEEVQPGEPLRGDLLMIPGPFGLRWYERLVPRMETGEIAANDLSSAYRAIRWVDLAPRIGNDVFIKLYTHGAQERNSSALLQGGLDLTYAAIAQEAAERGAGLHLVSAWEMYLAIEAISRGADPVNATARVSAAAAH